MLIHAGGLAKAADFTVRTINDEYAYTINGVVGSPRLTLIRGQTYTFDVSTCSCHPLMITDSGGVELAGSFITNNGTNSGTIVFTVPLTATTYQYRCTIHTFGNAILTLASLPPPPVCSTLAASNVASGGASLGTSVKGNGAVTSCCFTYGTDPALLSGTTTTAGQGILSLNTLQTFSANITGLQPATTYYYRAQATNIAGTTTGSILSFTTLSNNANLSNLTLSSGTLAPVFSSGTTSYSASVSNATGSVTFTVEWSDTMLAGSWTSAATSETILFEDSTVQNVKTTLPAGTNGHRFVHLAVAGP